MAAPRAGAQTALAAGPGATGEAVYARWCSGCHGDKGAGDGFGAAFMLPRPRDFTLATFHVRTTGTGEVPTDADLRRQIADGLPGTAMGPWRGILSEQELDSVVAYLKTLSPFFAGPPPSPLALGAEPAATPEGIAEGRRVYQQLKCADCHGTAGRGDGPSVPTLLDDQKVPTRATDLTKAWQFRGGSTAQEIYRGLRTGFNGTPMPSFGGEQANGASDEQLWRLAQYVRSLSPADPPLPDTLIRAALARGPLPRTPDDTAWAAAPAYYVRLAGQMVVRPRWFAPAVDGVWVQALHDRRRLTIRLTWHDPSRSPDATFDPWVRKVAETMAQGDPPAVTEQGPDRFALTLPVRIGADSLRPHFLGGSATRPAHMWRWSSAPDAAVEGGSRGLARFLPLPTRDLTHAARFENGAWRLQLTRAFLPSDTTVAPTFSLDQRIPVAFFAADGSNGEVGTRGSMSGWHLMVLDTAATAPALK